MQAAGVCPLIMESLRSRKPSGYSLDAKGAHEFLRVKAPALEQARDNEAMAIAYVRLDRARNRHELGQTSDLSLLELESGYQALLRRQKASQARQRATRSRLALVLNHPEQLPAELEYPVLKGSGRELGEVEDLVSRALSDNPKAEIVEILGSRYGLID